MTDETQAAERPKRLTLSEIVEMLLTRSSDRNSVALTRTASGDVHIEVKATAETLEQAGELAQAELERLQALYPHREAVPTVSLTRNAKGDTQVDVKGSGYETVQADYDRARSAYPMANGLTAKPGSVA